MNNYRFAALTQLRLYLELEQQARLEREKAQARLDLTRAGKEVVDRMLSAQLLEREENTAKYFDDILKIPPDHHSCLDALAEFHTVASFESSVFVMTKYPRVAPHPKTAADKQLEKVISAVKKAIKKAGFCPRLASDKSYCPMTWNNIEICLLGCSRGVAILEDCYYPELNPNIAMEWGWMRAMKRKVLYLREKNSTRNVQTSRGSQA
jgi:hypothetical protein